MKKIYIFLLFSIALFSFAPAIYAQKAKTNDTTTPPYHEGTGEAKGICYSKTIAGPDNGIYTITLESFVRGEVKITQGVPADIVLVLDVSGSMSDDYNSDVYEAQPSTSYTYNDFEDGVYYYRDNNGNYYPVTKKSRRSGNTTYYGLYYSITSSFLIFFTQTNYYYLIGTEPTNVGESNNNYPDNSSGVRSSTETIFTGVLYKKTSAKKSRIEALREAVGGFIDVIAANSESSGQDNQLSIVKFAGDYYNNNERSIAAGNNSGYTQVVRGWTSVKDNVQSLKNSVNAIQANGATSVDRGLKKAQYLLADLPSNRESAKTIVVFTDGVPTHYDGSSQTEVEGVANTAITNALTIKGIYAYTDEESVSHKASVYTVGVFKDDQEAIATGSSYKISDYMNYLSSNYPSAASLDNPGSSSGEGFYQNAAEGDLESIFRAIATASGGAGASLDAGSVEAVDIVSQSFELPDGEATNIEVYYAKCEGESGGYLTFAPESQWIPNPAEGEDGHVSITIDGNTVKASGFEYSEEWCGPDATTGGYHGHKLVLLIPIKMTEEAVGGQGVLTNGPESGIYINGKNILPFEDSPDVNLPINIHIQKVGLSTGESAVFKIYRTEANKDGTPANTNWQYYKTVIVIEGVNEESTVKLRGLDPNYAYKIEEAGWSWAYNTTNPAGEDGNPLTEVTSDKLITNPFTFTNTLNTKGKTIIHAESAVVNDWSGQQGKQEGIDSKNTAPKAATKSK